MATDLSSSYVDEEDGAMSAINVTPLVDVTLVLLIVFMITVPVIVGRRGSTWTCPKRSRLRSSRNSRGWCLF